MAKKDLMKGTVKWFDVRKGYGFINTRIWVYFR